MNIDFELLYETGEYIGRKSDDLTEMLHNLEKTKSELDMYIHSEQSDDRYTELTRELSLCSEQLRAVKLILCQISEIYKSTEDAVCEHMSGAEFAPRQVFPVVNDLTDIPELLEGDFE